MRLVHTADVHLDACFAGSGMPPGFGNRRRQSLRDVFRAIIERAGHWPADALLIAGDLYEQARVTRDTIAFLQGEFESIGHVPVFIAPGNHDPYTTDAPYATEAWPENVHIFREPAWREFRMDAGGLVVHGFAFDGPDISSSPFGALDVPEDGETHVAVGHGSERRHLPEGQKLYNPFDAEDAAVEGLAYLALGHFHDVIRIEGDFGTAVYYSGAPEGHSFGHTGMRHYLEVEIEAGKVSVRPAPSSRVVYTAHAVDCTGFTTAQQAVDAIRNLPNDFGLPQIARVTLTGQCLPSFRGASSAIWDAVSDRFTYLDLRNETLPEEDYDALAREKTSLGLFVAKLNQELRDTTDESRRRLLERARDVGLAAYRGRELDIHGLERS